MADIYRVIYETKKGPATAVNVSATSLANAIAAAKANDTDHKQHISATVCMPNVIAGS